MERLLEHTEIISSYLEKLSKHVKEKGDLERAKKVQDLLAKLARHKADITFCGHFSAGKSSLINRLCGEKILPSSPIPTSANVAAIENGEERIIIESIHAGERVVTLAELDTACRNGEEFKRVHIQYPVPLLQHTARLLDTPGVDSTDDSHRQATEDALHMADVIFYVMDYNHVLSELNFQYIRKLSELGKPLFLIVNQIDKHHDAELKFADFRKRVQEALDDWQVQRAGLFFVSVKEADDPNNEWPYLEQLLRRLVEAGESILHGGIRAAARQLIDEHRIWLLEQEQVKREELAEIAKGEGEADEAEEVELQAAAEELQKLHEAWEQLTEGAKKELQRILDNANVIPAPSRDIAHQYLESRKPGFRVGLLFSERKTAAEQERRAAAWREEVAQQADAQIRWHVTGYGKQLLAAWRLSDEAAEEAAAVIDRIHLTIEEEWLASLVQSGHFDDAYTLQYAKTVADQIKLAYRKLLWDALERLQELLKPVYEAHCARLGERLQEMDRRAAAQQELENMDRRLHEYIEQLRTSELEQVAPVSSWQAVYGELPAELEKFRSEYVPLASEQEENLAVTEAIERTGDGMKQEASLDHGQQGAQAKLRAAAKRLYQALELLDDLPMFSSFTRTLRDRASRLESNQYTIALFGAFSAGKSSFSNALLHTRVLPVSPNPTTAAINSVMPPSQEVPHGHAVLHYKTRQAMIADIRSSLEKLHLTMPEDEDQLIELIERADLSRVPPGAKMHVAFLNAVKAGWLTLHEKLGSKEMVDVEAYRKAVADETQACFLESVELYVDSAFAEQGMILVDTPGADSINARHTDVAFNYIKNADAILFVTYYNHAFSHADREFLLQLGRVKDSFALNKMFFIVNAADLASDEEELAQVVDHVRQNLATFGLHEPRIYPVSSMQASRSLEQGDEAGYERSGLAKFEADFYDFVQHELAEMSIRSGLAELKRSRDALAEWISALQHAQQDRAAERSRISHGLEEASRLLQNAGHERQLEGVDKEIQELIYYAAQRVTFRFGELYNLAFNPSLFADTSLSDREKLAHAYDELLGYLAFDLGQELRATTLRVEAYLEGQLQTIYEDLEARLQQMLHGFTAPEREQTVWQSPDCEAELAELQDELRIVRSHYRNNRQFFEQDGKAALRKELETKLQERIKKAALDSQQIFIEHYKSAFQNSLGMIMSRLQEETQRYAEAMNAALESDVELPLYEQRLASLERLLDD